MPVRPVAILDVLSAVARVRELFPVEHLPVGTVLGPDNPGDACEFVGQSDSGDVVSSSLLDLESPGPEAVGSLLGPGGPENRTSAMGEEHSQVDVALFADGTQAPAAAAGVFLGGEAEETGEMSSGAEPADVSDESDEGGGGEQSDSGDGHEALGERHLASHQLELFLEGLCPALEVIDFIAGHGQRDSQRRRNRSRGVVDLGADRWQDMAGTLRDDDAKFAQETANGVDACRSGGQIGEPESVQRRDGLLLDGLDRHRSDVLVAIGFEKCFGVGLVGLTAADVTVDVMRGQESDGVPEALELPAPVMGRATSFEQHGGGIETGEEAQESVSGEADFFVDATRALRDGDLEDGLCEIDGDGRILHEVGSSLPWPVEADFVWHNDAVSAGGVHPITCN